MMNLKRAVVFTGLIRNTENFDLLLTFQAQHSSASVEWVISTWEEEHTAHAAMFERAIAQGFRIVLCDQPALIGPGHIVHQKLSLLNALEMLDSDTFVMKARVDFLNLKWIGEFLTAEPEPTEPRATFTHYIRSHAFFLVHPFYINDIMFTGMACDIAKLCELDIVSMDHTVNLGAEQIFHSAPFLRASPWLRDYYRINPGLVFGDPKAVDALHVIACENRYFLSVMAAYFGELLANYRTFYNYGYKPGAFDGMTAYQFLCVHGPGFEYNDSCADKLAGSMSSLQVLRQRPDDDTSLGFLVRQLNAYLAGEMTVDTSDRDAFRKAVRTHLPNVIAGTSTVSEGANPARVARTAKWPVSTENVSVVNQLQNEISHLRRLVEFKGKPPKD